MPQILFSCEERCERLNRRCFFFFPSLALLLIIRFPRSLPFSLPNHARSQAHGSVSAGEHYARRVARLVDLDGRAAVGLQRLYRVSGPANDPAYARPGDEEHEGALRRAGSWQRRDSSGIMLREDSGLLLLLLRRWRREEGLWRKPQKGRAFIQHNEKNNNAAEKKKSLVNELLIFD